MSQYDRTTKHLTNRRPDLPDFRVPQHAHTNPRDGGALPPLVIDPSGGSSGGPGGGGSAISVTDGGTTVTPATVLDFTAWTGVTDLGGGVAGIAPTNTGRPLGLAGATAATRYAGATASGAPASGTFATGDFVLSVADAKVYVCTAGGTPGTWATASGGGGSGSITASGYTQATARLLGRTTASTGAIEEITVGSGLSLSAGALTATGGGGGSPNLDGGRASDTYGGTTALNAGGA